MPKPSRRLLLFLAAFLVVLAAPLVLFVLWGVHTAFTPPVAGTSFLSFDGPRASGSCSDKPSTKGGQVLVCAATLRMDSLFAVVDHNVRAVGWCMQRIDEAHYDFQPHGGIGPLVMGPLIISPMPEVPPDWGDCATMVPRCTGLSLRLILKH